LRRLLLSIIVFTLILTSCSFNSEDRILDKLEKHLDKYTGYKTELQMKTIMDDKENIYRMKESYTLGGKYRLEIIEPSESNGIIIEYDGDKIYIQHATIKESIELNSIKKFDQGLLIGRFLRKRDNIDYIEEKEIDNEKYYVFYNDVDEKNKYNTKQVIYLRKKDFKPYMLNILDSNNEPRVIIKYDNFEFTKD
jgi:outer membrane lipoprotein-sorting protein